jgi:hypothetical protein
MRGSAARYAPPSEVQKCFFFARTRARVLAKQDCLCPDLVIQSPALVKNETRKHNKPICVASAAVRNETGNFTTEQRLKSRPTGRV